MVGSVRAVAVEMVPFEAERLLTWRHIMHALEAGHRLPRAQLDDMVLQRGDDTLLVRVAWIDGLGLLTKTATIFPHNVDRPTVNGSVNLYSDRDGTLDALVDFQLVTKWKTAGDSLLAAARLARPDPAIILIVGAGTVGESLRDAYGAMYPGAGFVVWSRTAARAHRLADRHPGTVVTDDLGPAVTQADIVTCATMATTPLIAGEWLRPGQHVDLIGAYRPDMREADDEAVRKSRIFVDSRATTVDHIGELSDPIRRGIIDKESVVGDFYDLGSDVFRRRSDDEITLFKNGGGAHLDLMVARSVLDLWRSR